jgi:UPF0755 protein
MLTMLAVAALTWLWNDMRHQLNMPLPVAEVERLEIRPGSGLRAIAEELVSRGWIDHPYYLLFHARREGISTRLKAGEYAVEPGITPIELLEKIVAGRVILHNLTVVEGWSYRDLLWVVQTHPVLVNTHDWDDHADPEALTGLLDLDQEHPEGLFYPDTYFFPAGTTDVEFLQRSYRMMADILAEEWEQRAPDLPYKSPYEALIMASLIEKETGAPRERGEIAGVFVRRLEKGMRLQTDPTVIYALGEEFEGPLRRVDLQVDSPYNTYVYGGLPPTPIALPGRASIRAALNPEPGDTLYFVSRGDGTHYFSRTLEEHNRAVARYIRGRTDIKLENE